MTQERLIGVLSGIGALFVLAVVGLVIFFIRPLPPINIPPPPPLPADNGFDDCVRAVGLLKEAEKIEEIDPAAHPDQARALLDQNREAMATVRSAFGKEYMTPQPRAWDADLPYLPGFRNIARLFVLEGKIKASKGDYRGAAESFMDARRFGMRVPKGGPIIHRLLGRAITSIAYSGLESIAEKLDSATCRRVIVELEEISVSEPPMAETLEAETALALQHLEDMRRGGLKGSDGEAIQMSPHVARLLGVERAAREVPEYYRKCAEECKKPYYLREPVDEIPATWHNMFSALLCTPVDRMLAHHSVTRTQGRLLQVMLALRAFKLRRGACPASLSELVPEYLPRIPIDEFDGKPLKYKLAGDGYLLYSVGKDGKDDGGIPAKKVGDKDLGDIVAGRMYTRQGKTRTR